MGTLHRVKLSKQLKKEINQQQFKGHHCDVCTSYFSLFVSTKTVERPSQSIKTETVNYPPSPTNASLIREIMHGFCHDT